MRWENAIHRRRTGTRRGFTLVELLVVLAIIGLVTALTTSAVMAVLGGRRVGNTEVTIQKVDKFLQDRCREIVDEATEIPPEYRDTQYFSNGQVRYWGLLAMAGGEAHARDYLTPPQQVEARALVIYKKLRLRQLLPWNFDIARNPNFQITYQRAPYVQIPAAHSFRGLPVSDPVTLPYESSAIVLLAISQGRRGSGLTQDILAANELADIRAANGSLVKDANGNPLKAIVDAWGRPLNYTLFPTGQPRPGFPMRNDELDKLNPAQPTSRQFTFRDPLDPNGLLLDPAWNNFMANSRGLGVHAVEELLHEVFVGNSVQNWRPVSYYMLPSLWSAGKNGNFGVNVETLAVGNANDANDNIYSFRFRLGGRGD